MNAGLGGGLDEVIFQTIAAIGPQGSIGMFKLAGGDVGLTVTRCRRIRSYRRIEQVEGETPEEWGRCVAQIMQSIVEDHDRQSRALEMYK